VPEPDPIRRLIHALSGLPGIGSKTATRLSFSLIREKERAAELARALDEVVARVGHCSRCANLTAVDPCATCSDPRRSDDVICVVERPQDLAAMERASDFRGRFHVLHGVIDLLHGVGPESLPIEGLLARVRSDEVKEVVLATNPTPLGDITAHYLATVLRPLGVRVTRLAQGVSLGSEIEYADQGTLTRAFQNRQDIG